MPLPTSLPTPDAADIVAARQMFLDRGLDALEVFNADRRIAPVPDLSDAWVAFDMFACFAALERLADKGEETTGVRDRLRATIESHKLTLLPLVAALFNVLPGEWVLGADARDRGSVEDSIVYLMALDDLELAHITLDSLDCDLGTKVSGQLAGTVARVLEAPQEWLPAGDYVRALAHVLEDNPEDNPLLALTQHKFNVILKSLEEN